MNNKRIRLAQVHKFMNHLGIDRGFEPGTINRKIKRGAFYVPYILIGLTKYFKEEDIIKWLERQDKYND